MKLGQPRQPVASRPIIPDNKFDGLYVGRLKGKDLTFAGKVDHVLDNKSRIRWLRPQGPPERSH
jgi:hypothetical protein